MIFTRFFKFRGVRAASEQYSDISTAAQRGGRVIKAFMEWW